EDDRVRGVDTPTGPVSGSTVINCAGSWSGTIDSRARRPIRPAKGQMLAVDPRPNSLRCIVAGPGGSAVPRADGRTLIGATVDDVGFDKDVIVGDISRLFEGAARVLPCLRQARFLDAWAGLRPVAPDHLPVIGRDPSISGLVWATGHYTMGILSAPATARAVADLVLTGGSSIPIDQFGVDRLTVAAVRS
ncbi:MAG TPA: FAD-dependent oxidoreductase, partial [Chloroflexota bacterium]|nr:FAD-dependent oxidoreductase [Chloroflexota bacterium]